MYRIIRAGVNHISGVTADPESELSKSVVCLQQTRRRKSYLALSATSGVSGT
jgi:hypothetical protein